MVRVKKGKKNKERKGRYGGKTPRTLGSHNQTKRDALIAEFAQFMKQEYPSKLGYDYPKFWGEKVAQAGVAVSISTTLS